VQEEADVKGHRDGIGESKEFPGGGAAADAVGAVGGPVLEAKACGSVCEEDEVPDLATGQEGQCGP